MKFWDVGSLPLNFLSVNHKKVEDDLKEHHPDSYILNQVHDLKKSFALCVRRIPIMGTVAVFSVKPRRENVQGYPSCHYLLTGCGRKSNHLSLGE